MSISLSLPNRFSLRWMLAIAFIVPVGACGIAGASEQPAGVNAQLRQAAALLAKGKPDAAERIVQGLLKADPRQPLAINLLGVIRAESERDSEAENLFRRALELNPKLGNAYGNLGVLYRKRGDIDQAYEMLKKAVELSPRDARNRFNLAMLCGERGDFASGIIQMQAIAPAARPGDYWTRLAGLYITSGRLDDGEKCLKRELEKHPDSIETLRQLAGIALKRDDPRVALNYIVQALKIASNSPELIFEYAQLCRRAGLVPDAIVAMRRLLMIEPDRPEYVQFMGAVQLDSRDEFHQALPYFERYVKMKPNDPTAHLSLSWALIFEKDFERARKEIAEALRLDPGQLEGYYQLGMIAAENGQTAEAITQLSRVVQNQPDHAAAQRALGSAYMREGQLEKARAALETAEKIEPQYPGVHYQLSQVCARLGDDAAAERERKLYLEAQKKAPKARDAQMPASNPPPR